MPHLQKIFDRYRSEGMKMVAINIIPDQDELVPEWKAEKGFDFEVLVGADQAEIMGRYEVLATPTTFVVDSDRRLLLRIDGIPPDANQRIEQVIRRQLGLGDGGPAASH